jgi:1,4-alpha-glucan branching enzyme
MTQIAHTELQSLVDGTHGSPRHILGIHSDPHAQGYTVRTYQPFAQQVHLLVGPNGPAQPMQRIHEGGIFEFHDQQPAPSAYTLRVVHSESDIREIDDPYRFPTQITDVDIHLHGEGTHYRTYLSMGAHERVIEGVSGVHFAVWAPNARRVSVVGEFNRWDGRVHPMERRGGSGLWEIFIPALAVGDLYKYEINGQNGYLMDKSDPYAFASEVRPHTASEVWDNDCYEWNDGAWMADRMNRKWHEEPISVYEVHLGSWRRVPEEDERWLTYRELADQLVPYVKDLGFTHIELLPITEHPFDGSWGYQTLGYFSATSRFGTPDDLKVFIDRCHQEGIGVILDWVPAHFPRDAHGLAYFDGSHLYEHADPRQGEHRDWGTLIFNYGRNEVKTYLLSSAVFWADVYHIDGIRVDAVASMLYLDYSREEGDWIPNKYGGRENLEAVDFLKKFNEVIHGEYPGFLTFAEESTAWPMVSRPTYLGGLGFDLKWNMGWMHDTLEYFAKDSIHRQYHHNDLTFSLIYAFTENFILPFSHDEVVHGKRSMLAKMPGDLWQQFANIRLLYAYMFAHPGKKLLFMGQELGQWNEWNAAASLDWHLLDFREHQALRLFLKDLNRIYTTHSCLYVLDFSWDGFQWIDLHDSHASTLSFIRWGESPEDFMVCLFNFTPVVREGRRFGVPLPGAYDEILNSDAGVYGGGNIGNAGRVESEPVAWDAFEQSIFVTLPPLAGVFFRPCQPARIAQEPAGESEDQEQPPDEPPSNSG